jgi:lysophospholipase L1-like esterase
MRMQLAIATLIAGLAIGGGALAASPRHAPDQWVGTWEFVATPLPPGVNPPGFIPQMTPMTSGSEYVAPRPFPAPRIDNPGNVPVESGSGDLVNMTIRHVIRTSVGGQQLRLRFSNEASADALVLASVHVAVAAADGAIVPGTDHEVHFNGKSGAIIPASAPILSDTIDLATQPLQKLYVSIHVPGPLPVRAPRSWLEYVAGEPGDFASAEKLPKARIMRVPTLLTLAEVRTNKPAGVVVALGDSITEGATSIANAFHSYPDFLAERLAPHDWAVVNAGISGNRLLRYGAGPSALARLDRDVLSVPGAKVIILLEGINDIGRSFTTQGVPEPVTLESLEAADLQIITRAHEHGIRVIGATLTPYVGAGYANSNGEAVRKQLNAWIKSSAAFDAVIDFEVAVADHGNADAFAPGFNDGDHLHPNDAGYKAMADSIDLKVITGH